MKKYKILILILVIFSTLILVSCTSSKTHDNIHSEGSSEDVGTISNYYSPDYDAGFKDAIQDIKSNPSLYTDVFYSFLDSYIGESYVNTEEHIVVDYIIDDYMSAGEYDKADQIKNALLSDYELDAILGYPALILDINSNMLHTPDCESIQNLSTRYMLIDNFEDNCNDSGPTICTKCSAYLWVDE